MKTYRAAIAFGGSCLLALAEAQCEEVVPGQYTGTPFDHSIESTHDQSEITFFKIRDPSGDHVCTSDAAGDLSFLNFMSLNSTGGRIPNDNIQRLVFSIHGARRDPWNYHAGMLIALDAVEDNEIDYDSVAVIAPYFPDDDDAGTGFPYNPNGATPAEQYPSPALVWYSSGWSGGANNQYPPNTKTVSSFDVLDQIIQHYSDRSIYPNLHQIVVAGHSMGAQMVHRYAAIGKNPSQLGLSADSPSVTYWVGDPNSYLWLSSSRPLPTDSCDIYNDWREGLSSYEPYGTPQTTSMTYQSSLVATDSPYDAVLENYNSKTVTIARAGEDFGDYTGEPSCAPYTTGSERNERLWTFLRAFPPSCPSSPSSPGCHTIDLVPGVTHDAPTMYISDAGRARLFTDNWSADSSGSAYDFGYPRFTDYDDPYPDPAHADDPLDYVDGNTYDGDKTWRGCWSDADGKGAQTVGTFSSVEGQPFYSGEENTATYCSGVCTQAGFSVAGTRGNDCFCGNGVDGGATQVVSASCQTECPGQDGGICGGEGRLSVFSSVDL